MRKGIKILRILCTTAVLLFVVLPLLLSMLLHIPPVQNYVLQQAAAWASDALGTRVAFRQINVGVLGKVSVKGFYTEDFQGDTLLYVDNLNGFATGLGIFGGGLQFRRAEIMGARLYLKETPSGVMNIKQVVDKLSNPKRKKKKLFKLSIKGAAIDSMNLRIERLKHRNPVSGVDYGDMEIRHIRGHIQEFSIKGPDITTIIHSFGAEEKSGFRLEHLSGGFFLTNGVIHFEDAKLITEKSFLHLPWLKLDGEGWPAYKDFVHNVTIEGEIRHSTLSSDDVGCFAPRLKEWKVFFAGFDTHFKGTVADFEAEIKNLKVNNDTKIHVKGRVRGLPDWRKTHFDLQIPMLSTTAKQAEELAQNIARKQLPQNIVKMLDESGRLNVTGRFNGTLSSFQTNLTAKNNVGSLHADLKMQPHRGDVKRIQGGVSTRRLNLGKLLSQKSLGEASFDARIDGVIGRGGTDANIVGNVSQLVFKDYHYDSLRFDGHLKNRQFDGEITARDKNLDLDFLGLIDYNRSVPDYDFSMHLRHADLQRLNLNQRDSLSQISAQITARGSGRTLDDLNGEICVTNATYHYNQRVVHADSVVIRGENSIRSKYINLHSDFVDATFRSKISYHEVFEYLSRSAWKYFPMLVGRKSEQIVEPFVEEESVGNTSKLNVNVRHFNPVADAISPGLQIADGSTLQFSFNPFSDKLSLKAESEYVEHANFLATGLNVKASNRGDSISLYGWADDLYAAGLHLPRFSATGGAKMGTLQVMTGFSDPEKKFAGAIGFRAGLLKNNKRPLRTIDIRLLPSSFSLGEDTWQISAHRILVDTSRIDINNFFVLNERQDLLLNGAISRSKEDSLVLHLRNFNLKPLSQLTMKLGYHLNGVTNGRAVMKALKGGGEITANINVDSLSVNGRMAPKIHLGSQWEIEKNKANVDVVNRETGDTLINGYYLPNTVGYYARMRIDSLDMGLLDPLLSGVISSTKGVAKAHLEIKGEKRKARLWGGIKAKNLSTKVDFTQVTYTVPEAFIKVDNNQFKAMQVPLHDDEKNWGKLDFNLDLSHLSNISYKLRVYPEKMLVLNTTQEDNDVFYGKVFASGLAQIMGEKGNVQMDISATTDDNSSFHLPLSSKSNISSAGFVTFRKPEADKVNDLELKKKAFEHRRRKKEGAKSNMNINMLLNVKPNAELELSVSGNTLKARGDGSLNLLINPQSNVFEMYGDYVISQGSFLFSLQNILNRKFTVEPGSAIRWTGSPLNAALDIEAIYKLKASLQPLLQRASDRSMNDRSVGVECVIRLDDWLTDPAINFDVRVPTTDPEMQALISTALNTPETVDMQFLYLLLFKSFMAENTAASQNLGASMSYNTGLEFLTNQLSNWLSANDYNIVIRYRPKSELTSDEVDFGLSKSLINDRLLVEVEGNYLIDNKKAVNSSMSNFMGEAYITYLIDRGGGLKLKAFTQTIDRFDENQGLQETGVGIYFKQDFDNFKDFRRRIKERFTNKQRKERRMARRREKARVRAHADSLKRGLIQPLGMGEQEETTLPTTMKEENKNLEVKSLQNEEPTIVDNKKKKNN